MSLDMGRNRLFKEFEVLRLRWEQAQLTWQDVVRAEFTQENWRPLDQAVLTARAQLEEEFRQAHTQLEESYEAARQAQVEQYQAKVVEISAEEQRVKDEVRGIYAAAKDTLFQEFKESRWTTHTVYEADKKV